MGGGGEGVNISLYYASLGGAVALDWGVLSSVTRRTMPLQSPSASQK